MPVCHIHIQKRVGLESLFLSLVFHSVVSRDFLYSKEGPYSELKEKEQKLFSNHNMSIIGSSLGVETRC
jgi:hypothetical protein